MGRRLSAMSPPLTSVDLNEGRMPAEQGALDACADRVILAWSHASQELFASAQLIILLKFVHITEVIT